MQNDIKSSLDFIYKNENLHESEFTLNKNRKTFKRYTLKPIIVSLSVVLIAAMVFLPYIVDQPLNVSQGSDPVETQMSQSEIFDYKGAYIGDHLSVGKIISYSLENRKAKGIQLFTSNEPFGVRTFMETTMVPSKDYETIFTTASYLFTLIRNIEFVEFEYKDQVYMITKSDVELTFNVDYYSIEDENELRSVISDLLKSESSKKFIQQLITAAPIE
ncbi:DUF4825 domain-containing protein [Ureibacillus acetophenoni]|uniref:Uncharacterized protein DUF4825 n=1 Tax=Ureibacillus acetophenoni TaxID=614649 RepID=A0A285ULR1_9BACL|nr:DUF4825 domain-containing protein [Ureibacillus acetophenoni]SOC42338.1 uncharacterized protein DUF4825 [Ureibacillus acetophenoni]